MKLNASRREQVWLKSVGGHAPAPSQSCIPTETRKLISCHQRALKPQSLWLVKGVRIFPIRSDVSVRYQLIKHTVATDSDCVPVPLSHIRLACHPVKERYWIPVCFTVLLLKPHSSFYIHSGSMSAFTDLSSEDLYVKGYTVGNISSFVRTG